jgi:hypothetical protein
MKIPRPPTVPTSPEPSPPPARPTLAALIETAAQQGADALADATRRYGALLDRRGALLPGDAEKLRHLAAVLAIGPDDVAADIAARDAAAKLEPNLLTPEREKALAEDLQTAATLLAETENLFRRRLQEARERYSAALLAQSGAGMSDNTARHSHHRIRATHPRAFGQLPPPPPQPAVVGRWIHPPPIR